MNGENRNNNITGSDPDWGLELPDGHSNSLVSKDGKSWDNGYNFDEKDEESKPHNEKKLGEIAISGTENKIDKNSPVYRNNNYSQELKLKYGEALLGIEQDCIIEEMKQAELARKFGLLTEDTPLETALLMMGFELGKRTIRGGAWTEDSSRMVFRKNGITYDYLENVDNVTSFGVNYRDGFSSAGLPATQKDNKNCVLVSEDLTEMIVMIPERCEYKYEEYSPYTISKMPYQQISVKDSNDGMQWIGADFSPTEGKFIEPLQMLVYSYSYKDCAFTKDGSFIDKHGDVFPFKVEGPTDKVEENKE